MRQPKPFFRKFTQSWYVTIDGRQFPLGRDETAAWDQYHRLMSARENLTSTALKVVDLFEAYLDWVKANRSPGTYEKLQHYLSSFAAFVGSRKRVDALQPRDVTAWLAKHPKWTSSTGNDASSIVQRAFNWAVKHRHLDHTPLPHIPDKPPKRRLEVVYSESDWQDLRAMVTDQPFSDFLDFMWETGCRPLEARSIEARHVDLKNGVVIFPPSEAKGQRHERVVFLTDKAADICRRGVEEHPAGPILRNLQGRPWTRNAINCRFRTIRKKLGRPANAYAIRHSYATEALLGGCDSTTLAQLMGHQDTTMVSRTYAHLARNPRFLSEQAKRIRA